MKKTLFLIMIISLLSFNYANAQFLHVGAKSFFGLEVTMDYFEYNTTDYVYYFANENNETIRFSGFESSKIKSKTPFPDVYVRYDWGNNVFFQFDVFNMWFTNEAKYKNSVDFSEYSETFNPNSEFENLGYNNIKLNWGFWGSSLSVGYVFLKSKAIRPYIYLGSASMHLTKLELGNNYNETRSFRDNIIFTNLSTFKRLTMHSHSGFGFKYYGFAAEFFVRRSVGEIDIYSDRISLNDESNSSIIEHPNYRYFQSVNVALSLNLYSFNLNKKKEEI